MFKYRPSHLVSIFLALVIFVHHGVLAYAAETNFWAERRMVYREKIPSSLFSPKPPALTTSPVDVVSLLSAFGSAKVRPSTSKNSSTVIHIQDIHQNQEAQKNISHVVSQLIQNKSVDVIAVEGASGPIDLSVFHQYPQSETVKLLAQEFLERNKISGPIYSAIAQPSSSVNVIGIEDGQLYQKNIQAYQLAVSKKNQADKKLKEKEKALMLRKQQILNADVLRLDADRTSFSAGQLQLRDYVLRLKNLVGEKTNLDVPLSLQALIEAIQLETSIDFKQCDRERSQLLNVLVKNIPAEKISELTKVSLSYRSEKIAHADFYRYLKQLCAMYGVSFNDYPQMSRYLQYVLLSDSLDGEKILADVYSLERSLLDQLTDHAADAAVIQQSTFLQLSKKWLISR